ncbi:MAG: DNA-binding protein [Gammaproteobacteria bacterium]|jgi:gp16 family phage-associated protein|nr:DNA-binding protein [Gammaproteobacteria bacterium]
MKQQPLKTPEQVKEEFASSGESISAWCRRHRVTPSAAYRVLTPNSPTPLRGECHRAAVLLGIKHGVVRD